MASAIIRHKIAKFYGVQGFKPMCFYSTAKYLAKRPVMVESWHQVDCRECIKARQDGKVDGILPTGMI